MQRLLPSSLSKVNKWRSKQWDQLYNDKHKSVERLSEGIIY